MKNRIFFFFVIMFLGSTAYSDVPLTGFCRNNIPNGGGGCPSVGGSGEFYKVNGHGVRTYDQPSCNYHQCEGRGTVNKDYLKIGSNIFIYEAFTNTSSSATKTSHTIKVYLRNQHLKTFTVNRTSNNKSSNSFLGNLSLSTIDPQLAREISDLKSRAQNHAAELQREANTLIENANREIEDVNKKIDSSLRKFEELEKIDLDNIEKYQSLMLDLGLTLNFYNNIVENKTYVDDVSSSHKQTARDSLIEETFRAKQINTKLSKYGSTIEDFGYFYDDIYNFEEGDIDDTLPVSTEAVELSKRIEKIIQEIQSNDKLSAVNEFYTSVDEALEIINVTTLSLVKLSDEYINDKRYLVANVKPLIALITRLQLDEKGWSQAKDSIFSEQETELLKSLDIEDKTLSSRLRYLSRIKAKDLGIRKDLLTYTIQAASILSDKIRQSEVTSSNKKSELAIAKAALYEGLKTTATAIQRNDQETLAEANLIFGLGFKSLISFALDAVPVVGSVKSVYEIISGEDPLTGKTLSTTERALALALLPLDVLPLVKPKAFTNIYKNMRKSVRAKSSAVAKISKRAGLKVSQALSKQMNRLADYFIIYFNKMGISASHHDGASIQYYKIIATLTEADNFGWKNIDLLFSAALRATSKLGSRYSRITLPKIDNLIAKHGVPKSVKEAFDGSVERIILEPGDIIYQARRFEAVKDGHYGEWYASMSLASREQALDTLKIWPFGNDAHGLTAIVVKERIPVYYGMVADAKIKGAKQIMIPREYLRETVEPDLEKFDFFSKFQNEVFEKIYSKLNKPLVKKLSDPEFKKLSERHGKFPTD